MTASYDAVQLAKEAQNLGFVEFTKGLISGVYQVVVDSQIEQGKAFAELLSQVSKTVSEYQLDVSGLTTTGDFDDANNIARLDEYISEILPLLDPNNGQYAVSDENETLLINHFGSGVTVDDGTMATAISGTSPNKVISEDLLQKFVFEKVKKDTNAQYELLRDLIRIGFSQLDTLGGSVETGLNFYVGGMDEESLVSRAVEVKSNSWYAKGGAQARFAKWGFDVSGGYSASSLKVNTTDVRKSSAIQSSVTFTGKVKVDFATTRHDPIALGDGGNG